MVGTHAGDMIGEIALAIEMGADAVGIGKTTHPHPTLGESIGMARWRMAVARICRLRGSKPVFKLTTEGPNSQRFGLFAAWRRKGFPALK